ncbi:MAG: family 16 glycosylhydrolase, partial [Thermoguttaceae bacterium]
MISTYTKHLIAGVLFLLLCSSCFASDNVAETPKCPLADGNWSFIPQFSDEFNNDKLDDTKWHSDNPTWKGRQPGFFSQKNVSVNDGMLQLTAKAETLPDLPDGYHTYTTAAVQSKERVLYGYFEIRAKPMNSAASSAFWFYASEPKWWTEIDVFEISGKQSKENDTRYHMNLHVFKTPERGEKHTADGTWWDAPFKFADDFHIYALQWDKNEIKWFVDGKCVRTSQNTEWHQALTLNFDSETMPEWFGLPDINDLLSTFYIDYVRCWQQKETPDLMDTATKENLELNNCSLSRNEHSNFSHDATVFVEAEAFADKGGWVVDPQFYESMGSPMLLAHGLGNPVTDAHTYVEFPKRAKYSVYVRTRNWVAPWTTEHAPGKFQLAINDKIIPTIFGTTGNDWDWHYGGEVFIGGDENAHDSLKTKLTLQDLTGFDGRVDAICFSSDPDFIPPNDAHKEFAALAKLRRAALNLPDVAPLAGAANEKPFDLVVVGGGIAGTCTA